MHKHAIYLALMLFVTGTTSLAEPLHEQSEQNLKKTCFLTAEAECAEDLDSSKKIQDEWIAWHERLNSIINERVRFLTKSGFEHSEALSVSIHYAISSDQRVTDIGLDQKSKNGIFNVIVFQTIKSLDRDTCLKFPDGSSKKVVLKRANFVTRGWRDFRYSLTEPALEPDYPVRR